MKAISELQRYAACGRSRESHPPEYSGPSIVDLRRESRATGRPAVVPDSRSYLFDISHLLE